MIEHILKKGSSLIVSFQVQETGHVRSSYFHTLCRGRGDIFKVIAISCNCKMQCSFLNFGAIFVSKNLDFGRKMRIEFYIKIWTIVMKYTVRVSKFDSKS